MIINQFDLNIVKGSKTYVTKNSKDIGNTNSKDMGNTFLMKEVEPMPWKGDTVTEQRQRFLEDYQLNYYSITELAERFCISWKTANNRINRFKENGHSDFQELSH